jgi:hypothetical protein
VGTLPVSVSPWDQPTLEELARETARQISDERARPIIRAVFPLAWDRFVINFAVDDYWSERSDGPDITAMRMRCSGCRRQIAPMLLRSRITVGGGWRWVGLDYQEPYTEYFGACGWCGEPAFWIIHSPQ